MLKKEQKKNILLFLFLILISIKSVSAQAINQYKNSNGVIVSEKEYLFINEFYGKDYFNKMTMDDYNWIKDLNINESEVEIKTYSNFDIMPIATSNTQNGRKISIAKSCSNNCNIIVLCKWTSTPNIKSYDVIGARLSGTSLSSDSITTKITSSNGTEYSTNVQKFTNGFGTSVKYPSSGTSVSIEQKYTVSKGGIVYATHQHATKSITLATSKLYTIGSSGYGGVFNFYGSASGTFDEMGGLQITT